MITDPTRQLMAAVHFKYMYFKEFFKNREKMKKHFALPIEFGLDLDAIYNEFKVSAKREMVARFIQFFLPILAFVGLAMLDSYQTATQGGWLLFLSILSAALIEFVLQRKRKSYVRKNLLDSNTEENINLRQEDTSQKEIQNIVVHKDFSPFVGFGSVVSGWSFVVDLNKPDHEHDVLPLDVEDLYSEVTDHIVSLRIPLLQVDDFLFVHGQDVRQVETLFPNLFSPPVTRVEKNVFTQYSGLDTSIVRHYRMFQTFRWDGHLILSSFLRLTRVGDQLFVEFKSFLLPPVADEFCVANSLTKFEKPKELRTDIFRSILLGAFKAMHVFLSILGTIQEVISEAFYDPESRLRKTIKSESGFNFGAGNSLREKISTKNYDRYFQQTDKDMFYKILQARTLDGIANSLEKRGISTEEFKDQGLHVLNQGVIISGGKTNVENMAVGSGAKNWIGKFGGKTK